MTQLVRITATFFDSGLPKFLAGQHYAVTEETERLVAGGTAVLVEVDIDADRAEKLADKAAAAVARAQAAALEAANLAEAAVDAQRMADEAAAALNHDQVEAGRVAAEKAAAIAKLQSEVSAAEEEFEKAVAALQKCKDAAAMPALTTEAKAIETKLGVLNTDLAKLQA